MERTGYSWVGGGKAGNREKLHGFHSEGGKLNDKVRIEILMAPSQISKHKNDSAVCLAGQEVEDEDFLPNTE